MVSFIINIIVLSVISIANAYTPETQFFPSALNGTADWYSNWGRDRVIGYSHEVDPFDSNCISRGDGVLDISDNVMHAHGTNPRLYVKSPLIGHKWRNVEVTVFGSLDTITGISQGSGFAVGVRSNHDIASEHPCEAHGYYGKLWASEEVFGIAKEFYHGDQGVIYGSPIKNKTSVVFVQAGTAYGLKVIVRDHLSAKHSVPNTAVRIQVFGYADSKWQPFIDTIDYSEWSGTSPDVPCVYPYGTVPYSSSPVTRGGNFTILSQSVPGVKWTSSSIREIYPDDLTGPDTTCEHGIKREYYCCLASCGKCGGPGCAGRDGGAAGCCSGTIRDSGICCSTDPAPCNLGIPPAGISSNPLINKYGSDSN